MVKESTEGIEAIKELCDSYSYCDWIKKAHYPILGILPLVLYEEEDGLWQKVICHSENKDIVPTIRIKFFNATNFKTLDKTYGKTCDISLLKEDRNLNRRLRSFLRPRETPINYLIIDECDILEMPDDQKVASLVDLDFGLFSFLKSELSLLTNPNYTHYYCISPDLPVNYVLRIRNHARLFRPNVKDELCYITYSLHDSIYCAYLETLAKNPNTDFQYEECIINLDFDGAPQREAIYTPFRDCITNDFDRYYGCRNRDIVDYDRDVNMYGSYQIGIETCGIRFPHHFLYDIKCDYLEKRKELERKWDIEAENRKIERLKEEERVKEEEERNKDFNLKNKHGKDANIYSDNNHFYLGSQKLIGTTRIISNFFPTFDADYWAGIKAPLMGKTPQQLLDEWDKKGKESSEAGTKLHQRIDDYYHHKEVQTGDKDYTLFKQFADAYQLNPYRNEWAIYDEDSSIVGVVDMLDYSNGEYILYDWKRSEKVIEGGQPITKNKFDEFGLKPIENVPNTDYWHYALQLSFYRYILEKNYGIRIKESRLVVLHPSLNLPVVLTTPYMIDEVNKIIEVMKI